jgi:acylphosphatase
MKLRITIKGLKVHDVGYRPWLTELAMNTALRGFEVYNDEENGLQAVIALVEADEPRIKRFLNTIKATWPQLAQMSGVTSEDYTEDIMPVWQAATMGSFTQLNKAIPILLKIAENTDMIPQIAENTALIPQIAEDTKQTLEKQDTMIGKLDDLRADVVGEIRALREDLGGNAEHRQMQADIKQLQTDVRAIKEQRGIP